MNFHSNLNRNEISFEIAAEMNTSFINPMVTTIPLNSFANYTSHKQSTQSNYNEICSMDDCKKQNHSEIEKRRRDKMNHYIVELSHMIPMCGAMPRKLDKLTVLRMAVQHIKALKSNIEIYSGGAQEKPSFLSDDILMDIISKTSDGFMFVVSCEGAKILYVSQSVSKVLNYSQEDLVAQNWFNFLHHKDVSKVKEQLSSSDLFPKEKLIDAKTMLPIKTRLPPRSEWKRCPGARRSFFCRMKYKSAPETKYDTETTNRVYKKKRSNSLEPKYCVLHCIGYLTVLGSERMSTENELEQENEHINCLVAVGRTLANCVPQTDTNIELRSLEFVSRHTKDGKFSFVDHRATFILGYLPQELLGTTFYEYCHPEDTKSIHETIKSGNFIRNIITDYSINFSVLQMNSSNSVSKNCRFRNKCGYYIHLRTVWRVINNPWTKDFEFFIAKHTYIANFDAENCGEPKLRPLTKKSNTPVVTFSTSFDEKNNFTAIETCSEKKKQNTTNVIENDIQWNRENEANNIDFHQPNQVTKSFNENFGFEKLHPNLESGICEQLSHGRNGSLINENITQSEQTFVDTSIPMENNQIMNNFWSTLSIASSNENSSTSSLTNTSSNNSNQDLLLDYNSFDKSVESCKPLSLDFNNHDDNDECTMALIKSLLESDADLSTVDFNSIN
ncbi:protein cycle-like protein [Leptotrombidium deliense]|uniref:Protein cycle-like protein n=1 Tax=Leptotrombidium deliense TaxID=299467 RepID=A0A443SMB5_9ACAR|nr:protein cycle-like protein [Leptotrombidium deliense]